ncbi:MAG: GNAT family N-acetyltransferase [Rhodospirillales bacterium]|nr:GNAT family N-acetyltransferase [Rhodospirillales bacterium]
MEDSEIRILGEGDRAELDRFLGETPDTAMFLRSNLRQSGIVDAGKPYQGTYVGIFDAGQLTGVAALYWNGNMMFQCATADAVQLANQTLAAALPRACTGLLGPGALLEEVIALPPFSLRRARMASRQDLYALDLSDLSAEMQMLARVRPATTKDRETLAGWRHDYLCETLGAEPGDATRRRAGEEIARAIDEDRAFVLAMADNLLAYAGFNATLPDMVQVGGVYCPPAERGLGYARAATQGALLAARARGVKRAILFTAEDNIAAKRCYESLGFRRVGDYGIVIY